MTATDLALAKALESKIKGGVMDFQHTHSRADGPDTSADAALAARDLAEAQKARILIAIKNHGPMTSHEIARHVNLHAHQVGKRTPDLVADRLIEDSGARRLTPSGRMATVWRAVKP